MTETKVLETVKAQIDQIDSELQRLMKIVNGMGELRQRRKVLIEKLKRLDSNQIDLFVDNSENL